MQSEVSYVCVWFAVETTYIWIGPKLTGPFVKYTFVSKQMFASTNQTGYVFG